MATITIEKSKETDDKRSGEMVISINGTASGAGYEFTLKRKHIEVKPIRPALDDRNTPGIQHGKRTPRPSAKDWCDALTPEEKTQVFAFMLQEYRERSLGDNGFKGASIGAAVDKFGGQTRLFIGTNTTRWASPYDKHCAEQNMVNAATDTLMYERSLKSEETQKKAKPPLFKEVYVLQAVDEKISPIACPCGKCTDMLNNVMVENGQIYTLPYLNAAARANISIKANAIKLHDTAMTLDDIPRPDSSGEYHIWKTSKEVLNRNRTIELDGPTGGLQHNGFVVLAQNAAGPRGLPEDRAVYDLHLIAKQMKRSQTEIPGSVTAFVANYLQAIQDSVNLVSQRIKKLGRSVAEPAEKAAENMLLQRKSFAALDCVVDGKGYDWGLLNHFMVNKITDTVADRMRGKVDVTGMSQEKLRKWISSNIDYVRCVAIQMDDGTFRFAVQTAGKLDNAMPNAEVVALEQAVETLGRYGVRHVWAMEMNPNDIQQGIMRTSPKEGIERLMKRASPDGVDFHFMPFNTGNLTPKKAKEISVNMTAADVYPSTFKGARGAAVSNRMPDEVRKPPQATSWAALVKELQASTAAVRGA